MRLLSLLLLLAVAGCDLVSGGDGAALTAPGDLVGESLAFDGDAVLLGAPGSVEVFFLERGPGGEWGRPIVRRPTASRIPDPFFGQFLALDGDLAVVGAPESDVVDDAPGHAYLYARDGGAWTEAAVLRPDDLTPNAGFGGSVAVSGGRVAVAAGNDGCEALNARPCGRVHVFEAASGWARTAVLETPDPEAMPWFGSGVALDGERLVVAAQNATARQGRLYIYRSTASGWRLEGVMDEPPQPSGPSNFGLDLVIEGETLAVSDVGRDGGTVHVYRLGAGGWVIDATLSRPFPEAGPQRGLGRNLDLDGDRLIVSAPHTEYDGRLRGSAVVYVRGEDGQWTQEAELLPANGTVGFGRDVAISGETAVVGANRSGTTGGAHVFRRTGGAWVEAP